jgi:inner membrane protein
MTYKTHLSLGFASSFSLVFIPFEKANPFYYINDTFIFSIILGLIFISSLAPDFDEPGSYLSKRFPWFIVSRILSSFTTHRGVTHYAIASFFYFLIITLIAFLIFGNLIFDYLYVIPFIIIPYLFHPIGDSFTKGGVKRFFYPLSKKTFWILPPSLRFYTGSFTENIYLFLFTSLFIFELYYLIFIFNFPIIQNFKSFL